MRHLINIIVEATENFPPDAPAYHGSPNAMTIDTLRPSKGGELGPGLYFSHDRKTARGYAQPSGDGSWQHSGVIELDLSGLKIASIKRQEWLDRRAAHMDALRAANDGEWRGEFYNHAMDALTAEYQADGYDGIYDDWNQGIVFPDRVAQVGILERVPISSPLTAG